MGTSVRDMLKSRLLGCFVFIAFKNGTVGFPLLLFCQSGMTSSGNAKFQMSSAISATAGTGQGSSGTCLA